MNSQQNKHIVENSSQASAYRLSSLSVGDEVFWIDPDAGACSGYRTISEIVSDSGTIESDQTVVRLADNGSVTEAFAGEISLLRRLTHGYGNAIMVLVADRMGLAPALVAESSRYLMGGDIHPMTGAAIEREAVAMNERLRVDAGFIAQANTYAQELAAQYGFAVRKDGDGTRPQAHETGSRPAALEDGQAESAQKETSTTSAPRVTKDEQVKRAIRKLSRNQLIHLIDEAEGVGCWDESDKDQLRSEVTRLLDTGKITSAEILDLA
ncbi:hypothetical protein [Paraburkholderia sp. SIMBA_054]|uniref:hypothetical protein n=1 Tax=Paraburkholderia sp. SIMBA_054 TaxID=3085795 RepID=UPI00397E0EE2